ncbi:MAG: YraN family protein [Candidatus Omnitrophota bacterium]
MAKKELSLGKSGEDLAVRFIKGKGYKIIARRYKVKFGEIDIVALDKDTLCFIEVKSRRSSRFGLAKEAVSSLKQRRISKVALNFLKENSLLNKRARFDVVSVDFSSSPFKLSLIKDAFEVSGGFSY